MSRKYGERYELTERNVDLFWAKVDKQPDGCWIWTAAINHARGGYGCFSARGWHYRSHILAYRLARGPVPAGLVLDHLCRTPACVNPDHLEPVTQHENIVRGIGPRLTRGRTTTVTHCRRGHEFTPENTRMHRVGTPRQQRMCRTCLRVAMARSNAKRYVSCVHLDRGDGRLVCGASPAVPRVTTDPAQCDCRNCLYPGRRKRGASVGASA